MTAEQDRLTEARVKKAKWRKWGPYLSERQWGTVREDYSQNQDPWNYFPHDHARSRAYRWGEDGLAGICDEKQHLCFAISLWNGQDPILKERLFGLTSQEGNHGEDVKEYYFYLENTPTHSYMKCLYKYPQKAFPYSELVSVNSTRTRLEFEYELLDTKIFDEDRYYDVFIEYAKASDEDILIQISVVNRGPEAKLLHILPTVWFRNTWSWDKGVEKPVLQCDTASTIKASHHLLGEYWLYYEPPSELLFTENETNKKRLYGVENDSPYVKDGINDYIIHNHLNAVNPLKSGTKAALHYKQSIQSNQSSTLKLRLKNTNSLKNPFGPEFTQTFSMRKTEKEVFYDAITPFQLPEDMKNVQRQAFSGLLWNKQCYFYNVHKWLQGDPAGPIPPDEHKNGRNKNWWHLNACDVFSMPDKWEYPWFAAWDLAFHTITLAMIDPDFAKEQLLLLTKEWYMHPNGQIPAYEWSFGDVDPPVHAWAALQIYHIEEKIYGKKDRSFLERIFQKLTLNFTWWVNCKDEGGRDIFEGGFLGLDNIAVLDRSKEIPSGVILEQSDATGWMGMYCLNLLQIALELSEENPDYQEMAAKFFDHFVIIADAINHITDRTLGLWDEKKGFYYSLLRLQDDTVIQLQQDTLVGIIPLFAAMTTKPKSLQQMPEFRATVRWFIMHRPACLMGIGDLSKFEKAKGALLAIVNPEKLKKILQKTLDEQQFLSPYGMRSVSYYHAQHPFRLILGDKLHTLDYEPAESTSDLFGGNSNWRGPIWFPLNYLFIEALHQFHSYLGTEYTVEYPTGSNEQKDLLQIANAISLRLIKIFLKDSHGRRPLYGGIEKFQTDPHWKDYILFHEYFHADNGAGLGASNQTGWTALVALFIYRYGESQGMRFSGGTQCFS